MIPYELWQERFEGAEPIGYRLRDLLPDRWVRFHSLPESKRYPEDEVQMQTLLDRHNTILGDLAGVGEPVTLLTSEYSWCAIPSSRDQEELIWETFDPQAVFWRTVEMHALDAEVWGEGVYWHIFASEHVWTPGHFDSLIRLTALDRLENVLFVDPSCRWAVWPYDGGMDVIMDTPAARDRLRALHSEWLPRSGLL